MKRVLLFVGLSILLPVAAVGQTAPRAQVPTTPPRPAMPVEAPAMPAQAPLPPPRAMLPVTAPPVIDVQSIDEALVTASAAIDPEAIREATEQAREAVQAARSIDTEAIREQTRQAIEAARASIDRDAIRQAQEQAREAIQAARSVPRPMAMVAPGVWDWNLDQQERPFTFAGQTSESGYYSSGLSAFQAKDYDRAITRFDQVIAQKGPHADGAMYWKAFAQYKLSKSDDALATLADLRKTYGQSRYLNDAKVLEAEIRKPSPQSITDDDIKLLAIQGLQNTDPAQAIPLLSGVLNAANSLAVKKRALYVLALSDQPQAHGILLNFAKGGGNPDLQMTAISYLASRGSKQTTSAELVDIYNSTQDADVKRVIIDSLRSSGDKSQLMVIAGSGTTPVSLRARAMSNLSFVASPQDLWSLYEKEQDASLRTQLVRAFASMGAVDQLMQVIKTDKDAGVRLQAIRSLGAIKSDKTGATLVEMYSADQDKDSRRAIIQALSNQNNAEGLVAIARKETTLDLKREIVARLSDMAPHSKPAADYLMEIIK